MQAILHKQQSLVKSTIPHVTKESAGVTAPFVRKLYSERKQQAYSLEYKKQGLHCSLYGI